MFKFCPACGGQLPQAALIKYCPFCGTGLTALTGPNEAPVAATLEALSPRPVPAAGRRQEQAAVQTDEHRYYSVILKACSNQDRLARRLCQVLRRSLTATKMAVAMTPCIVIYKGKPADTQPVLAIFQEEKLPYAIIEGDFNANTVDSLIPGFHRLERSVQDLLRSTPAALWLGDAVKLVCSPVSSGANSGLLAVSDKNIYFVASIAGSIQWRLIPLTEVAHVEVHQDRYGATLELIYRDVGDEAVFHFADEEELEKVYEEVKGHV